MRPKRRVLLYCADYDLRNHFAFFFRVGWTSASFETFADVGEMEDAIAEGQRFDCIVLIGSAEPDGTPRAEDFQSLMRLPEVFERSIEMQPLDRDVARSSLCGRLIVLDPDNATLAIDAMKIASTHKRGPKSKLGPGIQVFVEAAV